MSRRGIERGLLTTAAALFAGGSLSAVADDKPVELVGLAPSITEQISYDNNLYRMPSDIDPKSIFGPDATRGAWINTASLRLAGRWPAGRQALYFDAHADQNNFQGASGLDHVSGAGVARWDWTLRDSTGQIGATYQRFFPGFANYRLPEINLVTRQQYFATGNFRLGPTWSINGAVRRAETFQSLPVRKIDEFSSNIGSVGLQLDTKVGNQYGIDYSYTRSTFPFPTIINNAPFIRDYYDSTAALRTKYALTPTLLFTADWGYLKREYQPASASRNFSGDIWHGSLAWQPSEKLSFTLLGARELTAYIDAESEYYIATRGGASLQWQLNYKIALRFDGTREQRRYVGVPGDPITVRLRQDTENFGTASLIIAPRRNFVITASGHIDNRRSNFGTLSFDDTIGSLMFTLSFR